MGKEGGVYGLFVVADNKCSAMIVEVEAEEVKEVGNIALEGVILPLKRANKIEGSARNRVAGTNVGG